MKNVCSRVFFPNPVIPGIEGYGHMSMKSIFLELSITCSRCERPLPVNRAAESVLCPHCNSTAEMPVGIWQTVATPRLLEAASMKPGSDSWATGIMAGMGSYRSSFGQQAPRCRTCNGARDIGDLIKIVDEGDTVSTCTGCGTISSVRRPPQWFDRVLPFARLLVDEIAPEEDEEDLRGAVSISIFCYHCGSPLPLDGSRRTVRCAYCNGDFLVPDDIWMRLHPVKTARPWYVIIDLGDAEAMLPLDINEFVDLAGMPDDTTALLWEEESEYRLGRVEKTGLMRWIVRGIPCTGYARLFYVGASDTLWIMDHDAEIVLSFNAATGKKINTIGNDVDDPGLISVLDNYNVAACSDTTLLVYRTWKEGPPGGTITERIREKGPHTLTAEEIAQLNSKTGLREIRRFDKTGKRISLWPGRDNAGLERTVPAWDAMPDCPAQPPENALLEAGPDGILYMMDPASAVTARYDRDGKFLGLIRPEQKAIREIEDFCIAGDGTICIIFWHKKKIGGEDWPHVARIGTDGSFRLLAGPHAPKHNYSIGTWSKRISASEQGSIHLCAYKLMDLRVLNPDGSLLWKGLWTDRYDETLAGELKEAREKK